MLKRRVIPIQLLLDGRLVKTVGFGKWRDVGDPVSSSRVYNSQTADELIFLNIARERRGVDAFAPLLDAVSEVCFMPLTVGGGVAITEDFEFLIRNGADKVLINSAAYRDKGLLREAASRFGTQAVVVGIDARWNAGAGRHELYADCGRSLQAVSLADHIRACVEAGAGEIVVQSIDRDGTMSGYDQALIKSSIAASSVPVVAAGGSGNYEHLREVLADGAAAVACGSLFNFSDSNPVRAKAYLTNSGLPLKVV